MGEKEDASKDAFNEGGEDERAVDKILFGRRDDKSTVARGRFASEDGDEALRVAESTSGLLRERWKGCIVAFVCGRFVFCARSDFVRWSRWFARRDLGSEQQKHLGLTSKRGPKREISPWTFLLLPHQLQTKE